MKRELADSRSPTEFDTVSLAPSPSLLLLLSLAPPSPQSRPHGRLGLMGSAARVAARSSL